MCGRQWRTCRCSYIGQVARRVDRRHIDIEWEELAAEDVPEALHEIQERLERLERRRMRYEYAPEVEVGDGNGPLRAADEELAGLFPEERQATPFPRREMPCRHDNVRLRAELGQCDLCAHQSPRYIFVCAECEARFCASCQRDQATAAVDEDIADARAAVQRRHAGEP